MNDFKFEWEAIQNDYISARHIKERAALKERLSERRVVLYGVGYFKDAIMNNLAYCGIEVSCFCDSFKTGIDAKTGLRIIPRDELAREYKEANIVITAASAGAQKAIKDDILRLGFEESRIFTFSEVYKLFRTSATIQSRLTLEEFAHCAQGYEWAYNFFKDERSKQVILEKIRSYLFNDTVSADAFGAFLPDELPLYKEVLVEGGVCTGNTTMRFINKAGYRNIFGYDIDPHNAEIAAENLRDFDNADITAAGLWSHSGTVEARLTANGGSRVIKNGDAAGGRVPALVVSLDDVFDGSPLSPTFILLDIEGSEKEALLGAGSIIKKTRPKLAVCAYFYPEYIYELPRLISGLNSGYKYMLRQHSPYLWDTVLYAW